MEIKKMLVDSTKEQQGVWCEYDSETKFLIGSTTGRTYKDAYQRELDSIRLKTRKPVSSEQAEQMQINVLAGAIVLGWEGVTLDGKEYPHTIDNAKYILKNCPQVREFIVQAAGNIENFKAEQVEEAKAQLGELSATP